MARSPASADPGRTRPAWLLPVLVGAFTTAVYCAFSWSQWIRWDVPSWDNAIFTQLLSAYASGHAPIVDIKGHGFNLLGDHFHPLLIVLAPIYAVFPSALTLMILQDVLFGSSAAVVTRCALHVLRPAPAVAISVAYAASFGLQNAVAVQFHEIALAVPLLALGLCALRERRWRAAALWSVPVALVKEDLGVTVAVIGALMLGHALVPFARGWSRAVRRRWAEFRAYTHRGAGRSAAHVHGTEDRVTADARHDGDRGAGQTSADPARAVLRDPAARWGAALMVWGVLASALAVGVILPALNPAGEFAYSDKIDLALLLRDPTSVVVLQVVPVEKLVTWLLLLLIGAVVAVRSPLALVALPTLAWRMLSPNHGYWGPGWHYSAVLMPVVFVALVDAIDRLRNDADRAREAGSDVVVRDGPARRGTAGDHAGSGASNGRLTRDRLPFLPGEGAVLRTMARAAPWAALVVALAVGTQQPLAQLATAEAWQPDPRQDAKAAAVERIPHGASVATDLSLMNGLVSTTRVHWIGNGDDPAPEYVVVDRLGGTWSGEPPADVTGYARDMYGVDYTVVSDEANIVVARRSA